MTHPVLDATSAIDVALKSVADVNPTFMSPDDKATALRELARADARLRELQMRILADAGDVAERTAAHDAAEWLAAEAHVRLEDARADLALGTALDRRWTILARALRDGECSVAQARVIAGTLGRLPRDVPADVMTRAEEVLVGHAHDFSPRQLARLAQRILDVVAPEIAEEVEARRLAALEAEAHRQTRLGLRRCGDGTTRITGLVPDAVATRLATYLEAFTNPRKNNDSAPDGGDPLDRLPYPRRLGQAFCQLLEAVDPTRLPLHGGDATTVMITIDLDSLRRDLGTAEVLGGAGVPGGDTPETRITAGEARRLACTAKLIPAVLGGRSEVLDLGRSQRLFSAAQRKAMLLRDRHCRAEGCEIPGTWCEAHHWLAWSAGGRTDLDDGVLLCHHHHHRVHDDRYAVERLPNGDVRFSLRP
ncbi:HNH endonuclease signature motif containing protein [Nocardioides sp. T2.26MG-1]|uniref:HNH endonuclease signature motif containing protein n=1 Tax=Nocardioides sp. T2.26MG-1 TaxID=3041166 RepID=UPI002477812E|nr:HNH endonuclease signature motif containing protein [Nocardioides sp. T2.26MG-1]CAI9410599.1 hypothetical protein HIDPHFAB_04960 [Nocardioides sp. T2.26MG-1]